MSQPVLPIDVWSDVVCPWCYIKKRRLEAALARFPHRDAVLLRWHAFELDPRATLARLAGEVGLDEQEARTLLDSDAYVQEVREDQAQARALRITGVPFFVVGQGYGVGGAQSPEVLLQVLEKAWGEGRTVALDEGASCGVEGGC